MPWYFTGYILVVICFLFIFQNCFVCTNMSDSSLKLVYYCFFPSAFNIGWAFMQVSHMSMICNLTNDSKKKDKLNGIRNTFTYIANFIVLLLAILLFKIFDD